MTTNATTLIEDTSVRSAELYKAACDTVWAALCFYRMRNPACWRVLSIVHRMGADFALTDAQFAYVYDRLNAILGE